jgi:alpha-aminoadipate carrier protein LysW
MDRIRAAMNTAECPECGATISFKTTPVLHELIRCADCGSELEVTNLEPIALDLAPTEEEDWGE